MVIIDLKDKKFGKLTVIKRFDHGKKHIKWLCVCECGKQKAINGDALKRGLSKTCGCGAAKGEKNGNFKHGYCNDYKTGEFRHEYKAWSKAKSRVSNPKDYKFPIYGGRGITMCQEWSEDFTKFLKDMGKRPVGHSIDRINVNGNYEPENCRWATADQQAFNKQNTIYLPSGEPLKKFCERKNLSYKYIHYKYKRGAINLGEL